MRRYDFDLLLFDYAWNDYTILGILLGPGPRNLLNYASDDVAGLVAQARTTADLERRQQLVLDAQRAVLEQAIWQPLLVRRITFAVDSICAHPSTPLRANSSSSRRQGHCCFTMPKPPLGKLACQYSFWVIGCCSIIYHNSS